jgi:catechol 2,3-dioxygenase-like lactoylglutathione lyase family enzyme
MSDSVHRVTTKAAHFILYVSSQSVSTDFYAKVLGRPPRLNVPGMTEFELTSGSVLGLMPCEGIRRLLGGAIPDPEGAAGIPRSEVYLVVDDASALHRRALAAGARELSGVQRRDWGHDAGYTLDPDGHVLAFANVTKRA